MNLPELKTAELLVFLIVAAACPTLPAAAPPAALLFADGFEKTIAGDVLMARGNDEWVCRDQSQVTVVADPRQAAEGKHFFRAVATGERLPEAVRAQLKIVGNVAEGGLHRSLAALGLDPRQVQGQELRFSIKARGNGYLQFYLYRYAANGGGVGNGANPYSPIVKVPTDWGVMDWTYQVPVDADVAEYRLAIHFFTGDERGIDLDECQLELRRK